jgi:hypothetical protein
LPDWSLIAPLFLVCRNYILPAGLPIDPAGGNRADGRT